MNVTFGQNGLKIFSVIPKLNGGRHKQYSQGKIVLLNSFSTGIYWNWNLAASDFFHVYTINHQNDQIDSKNERLLFSARFTAKFGLVFVLTQENAVL